MNIIVKYMLAAASLITAALWLHSGSPLTAVVDVALIATLLAALAWFEPRCVEVEWREWRNRPPSAAKYRRAEWAFKLLAITAALIYGAFLLRYGTLEGFFEGRQQNTLIERVDQLMASGQHRDAAQYLESSLRRRLPGDTPTRLQFKLLECWQAIAEQGSAADLASILGRAESLVREGVIDQAALANLRRNMDLLATIAAHESKFGQAATSAAETLAKERASRQTAEALAGQRTEQLHAQASERARQVAGLNREHAARHFGTLLAWGDSLNAHLFVQRDKYQEAIEFGRPWQFDTHAADQKLEVVLAAIRAQLPRDLEAGSSAKWLSFRTDRFPPSLDVEICVLDAKGHPVDGLLAKDFRVSLAGRQVSPLGVGHVAQSRQRLQVVILVDCSGSTAGPALTAAKAGTSHLLKQLSGHADVCVLAFHSTVTPLSTWEADPQSVEGRLATLQSAGGTAMYQGLDLAASTLRGRPSPRLIVLFSDGKDSTGVQPAALLDRLRGEQIVVHAVGLETAEFDRAAIERLTAATGGMLTTTSQTTELASRFAELSLALNAPRYRLVIPSQEAKGQLQIEIGNHNAVKIERTLDSVTPSR